MDYTTKKDSTSMSTRLKTAFFSTRTLPDALVNLFIMAQIGSLIVLSDSNIRTFVCQKFNFQAVSQVIMKKQLMIVEIIVILLLQLKLNISFIRLTYLRYFFQLKFQQPITYGILILAILSLLVDFLQNTSSLMTFRYKWSEKYNEMKILGNSINIASVVVIPFQNLTIYIVLAIVYFLYYLIKLRWQFFNEQTQLFTQIMCILGMTISITNVIQYKTKSMNIVYYGFCLLIFFLICNYFIKKYLQKLKYYKTITQSSNLFEGKQFVNCLVQIIQYLKNYSYDSQESIKLQYFYEHIIGIKVPPLNLSSRFLYLKETYNLALSQRERYSHDVFYLFVLGELQIITHNNYIRLSRIIHQLQNQNTFSFRKWIINIQIYKLKQLLKFSIENSKEQNKGSRQDQVQIQTFVQNCSFIKSLTQATQKYYELWNGFIKTYSSINYLETSFDSFIRKYEKLEKQYEEIKQHNTPYTAWIYYLFLDLMKNNPKLIKKINMDLQCLKFKMPDPMTYPTTIFVSITDTGKIIQISKNCQGLLDYHSQQLVNKDISKLIPFFCSNHKQLIQKYFDEITIGKSQTSSSPKYSKISICSDSQNQIKKVQICFSPHYINQQILFLGYLILQSNPKHLLAFNERGQILASGGYSGVVLNKFIDEQIQLEIEHIIHDLTNQKSVEIIMLVDDNLVQDTFTLFKTIQNQDAKVFVVQGMRYQQYMPLQYKQQLISTKLIDKTKHNYFHDIEAMKITYQKKNTTTKIFLKSFALCITSILLLILTGYLYYKTQTNQIVKRQCLSFLKRLQIDQIYITNVAGKIIYDDIATKNGVVPQHQRFSTYDSIRKMISDIHTSFASLQLYKKSILAVDYYQTTTYKTQSLLIVQIIVQIFDWMYNKMTQINFNNLKIYVTQNTQSLIYVLLPKIQESTNQWLKFFQLSYHKIYLIYIIISIIFLTIQLVLVFVFSIFYKNQTLQIMECILNLQNQDLTGIVSKIESYLDTIKCVSDKKQNNNNTEILRQIRDETPSVCNESGIATAKQFVTNKGRKNEELTYEAAKKVRLRDKFSIKHNYFVYAIAAILYIVTCVNIGLYFKYTKEKFFSIAPYIQSTNAIRVTFKQYQSMFTMLLLNINLNFTKIDAFAQAISNFEISSNKLQQYDQSLFGYSSFSPFLQMRKTLQYTPIVNYIPSSSYQNQLNVSYYTSLTYNSKIFDKILQSRISSNFSLTSQLISQNLQYLIYSTNVYIQIFNRTMESMFNGIDFHFWKVNKNSKLRMNILLTQITLLLLLTCYILYSYIRNRIRNKNILNIMQRYKTREEGQNNSFIQNQIQ